MAALGPYRTPETVRLDDEQAAHRAIERLIAESRRERQRRRARRAVAWELPAVALVFLGTLLVAGLPGLLLVGLGVALLGAVSALLSLASG